MTILGVPVKEGDEKSVIFVLILGAILLIAMLVAFYYMDKAKKNKPKPVKAKILDKTGKHVKGHAVTRGIVGSAVAGPIGAVVGAMSASGTDYTDVIFRVWWSDGSKTTETCRAGSEKYNLYIQLIPDED